MPDQVKDTIISRSSVIEQDLPASSNDKNAGSGRDCVWASEKYSNGSVIGSAVGQYHTPPRDGARAQGLPADNIPFLDSIEHAV
jgi:hypothetical protein